MKAALLTRHNSPLRRAEITPLPLDFGQVLVSGICGAQLQEASEWVPSTSTSIVVSRVSAASMRLGPGALKD